MQGHSHTHSGRTALGVAVVMLLLAASLLAIAYGYTGGSGIFPRFAGWVFVVLAGLEVLVQVRGLRRPSAAAAAPEPAQAGPVPIFKEIKGFLWLGWFVALIGVGGFLAGIPLYIFSFLRLSAGRRYWECAAYAAATTAVVYILFVVLLEYRLYGGLLF